MQANITREIGRTEASNRSANGRFAAGNPGGPGNPFAGLVASLRQAMLECVSKEDIQSIMKSLVEMAKEGHFQAAKLVLTYTLGKPQPMPTPEETLELMASESPSTNGVLPAESPSTNGVEPSTNGVLPVESPSPNGGEPSTNGVLPAEPPSTNGVLPAESPSINGENGMAEPILNRHQRRVLRKALRLAKQKRNSPVPVTLPGDVSGMR